MADSTEKIVNFEESKDSVLETDFQPPAPSVEGNKEKFDLFMRGGGNTQAAVLEAPEKTDKASLSRTSLKSFVLPFGTSGLTLSSLSTSPFFEEDVIL